MKRLLLSVLLTILFTSPLSAAPVCSALFETEQPNKEFESLYYNLKGILRDLDQKSLDEVWPRYSEDIDRLLAQNSDEYVNDFYAHLMYMMFTTLRSMYDIGSTRGLSAQMTFASQIVRDIAGTGGMTFEFQGQIFYFYDRVQFVFKDVLGMDTMANGRFVGAREVGSDRNLVFEMGTNNYIDVPIKNVISARPFRIYR